MSTEALTIYCMIKMSSGELLAGSCRYGYQQNSSLVYNRIYTLLPEDPNEIQCQQYKRKGLLCGKCIEEYGPPVYSFKFTLKCSKCSNMSPAVATALYLALELVPVTIYFFLIVTFRINVMSDPLLGYIFFCQVHARTAQVFLSVQYSILTYVAQPGQVVLRLLSFLSGIWSLDALKVSTAVIPPFCISEKISDLDALMFDYVVVVYTIVLSIVTYVCIDLHSRNCRIFVLLWKPFRLLCIKIRRKWSSSGSIIHAYTTLLILLFMRLNTIVYDINTCSPLFTNNITQPQTYVLLYQPQIIVFSPEHIRYLLMPFIFLFFLGFCPALFLCLYPTRFFRRATQHCLSARRLIALSMFAETFQGCYKNGLNGTRDYRMAPAIMMFSVLIWTVILSFVRSPTYAYATWIAAVVTILISFCVSYMRPCKSWLMNLSLSFHCTVVSLLCVVFGVWVENLVLSSHILAYVFIILLTVPHVLMLLWVGYSIVCYVREHRSQAYITLH